MVGYLYLDSKDAMDMVFKIMKGAVGAPDLEKARQSLDKL